VSSRDLKRYEALREIGCVACHMEGQNNCVVPEIHHLVDKGYRKHSGGNQATIPLCAWHHRGEPPIDFTVRFMRARYGPSMRLESREFAKVYGTQRELLARVNEMLKEHA
jgi:hypothetical protein